MSGNPAINPSSMQSRLDKFKPDVKNSALNVNAEEFIPPSAYVEQDIDDDDDDVEFFTEACLKELSESPGDFNIIVETFIKEFLNYLKSEGETIKLATAISDLCLRDENCRYMGVKLSCMLKAESEQFFSSLLQNCEEKYNLIFLADQGIRDFQLISNLALFLGELYVQFEDGNRKRNNTLNEVVVNVCYILLNFEEEKYLCTLVHLLKLIGQSLHQDSRDRLTDIIGKLEKLSYNNIYSIRSQRQITALLKTHDDRWHLTEKSEFEHTSEDGCDEVEEAVLYGPDGQVISLEEDSFLNNCCENDGK